MDLRFRRDSPGCDTKETIPISHRNGEVSEKAGSGSQGDGFSGPGKGRLGAGGTISEKPLCSVGSTGTT